MTVNNVAKLLNTACVATSVIFEREDKQPGCSGVLRTGSEKGPH